jgi:hypothetical protein
MDLWETTEAKEFGEIERLELGGHEIVIRDAREYKSELSGNTSLKICVDIGGNDKQKGFFQKQFDENPNSTKKWSNGATKYVSLKDEQIAYLKGTITAIEKSNPGFKFNIKGTWEQLKGLKLAGVFGLEEYQKEDGSIGTATKLVQFRSLDKLNEIKIPKVKLLSGELMDYEEYKNKPQSNTAADLFGPGVVEVSDNLPFEI